MLLVAGEPERDRLVGEAGARVEVERMAGLGEPEPVRQVARAADHQPLLMDGDAGGPAMRLAERLLGPVARRQPVFELRPGRRRDVGAVQRVDVEDADVAALDPNHRPMLSAVNTGSLVTIATKAPAAIFWSVPPWICSAISGRANFANGHCARR